MQAAALAGLPPRVAAFYVRAVLRALNDRDKWSLDVVIRPRELRALIKAARGRRLVVELGTGTGWSAIALAIADPARRVISLDPVSRVERGRYLALVPARVRDRITFYEQRGEDPPPPGVDEVDILFVDGAHDSESTVAGFESWRPRLAQGGVAAFHDYGDPAYPGVQEAVDRLRLDGERRHRLFIWQASR
jgi:predicted O-methyltransferase YrrM